MELRRYWRVFWRRWWIAALITVATGILSFVASPLTQGNYTASMRVLLSVPAEPARGAYFRYDKYYSLLSSEYLTDDFIEVVRSQAFRDDVREAMGAAPNVPISIHSLPRANSAPRILTILVTGRDPELTQRAAAAAAGVLTLRAGDYFSQLGPNSLIARVIDPPTVAAATASGRNYLNILLRTLVGLMAGVGLVFFLHYLDTTLYDREDLARHVGIPILAEIPPDTPRR